MDKGVKILQKHLEKIEKANNQILDKTLMHAFNLKRTRLSDISYKRIGVFEILIHKDTNNFPQAKQKLLTKIADLHIQYPFITLCFDSVQNEKPAQQPQHARTLRASNDNRLILQVNWADYIRTVDKTNMLSSIRLPEQAVSGMFQEMKQKNYTALQETINMILATAKYHVLDDKTETNVKLADNTMIYEVTRNHYTLLAQQIMKQYNGMIEIFHTSESTVGIRVHWNVYLAQIATKEREQIHLLPDYNQYQQQSKLANPAQFVPIPEPHHRRRHRHRHRRSKPESISEDSETVNSSDPLLTDTKIMEPVPLSSSAPTPTQTTTLVPVPQISVPVPYAPQYPPVQPQLSQPVNNPNQLVPMVQPVQYPPLDIQPQASQPVNNPSHPIQLVPMVQPAPIIYEPVQYPPLDIQTQLLLAPSPPETLPNIQARTAVII